MPRWSSSKGKQKDALLQEKICSQAEHIELQLLQGVRQGRRADFESLYRIYSPRLQRFLLQLMRHGDQVEEVLNDTMMVVWQRAETFENRSRLSTWIFGIAYRKALKSLNRLDFPQEGADADDHVDPGPGPEQQFGLSQLRLRLHRALGELSVDHRAVVELCYLHEMAYGEIAQIVGCAPETVKTRMFYAKRRLRGLLVDLAEHPEGEHS